MGGIINNPPFQETFPDAAQSATLLGTIVAIYEIGCCVGAIACAIVGEKLGRRMSILLGAVVMLGGAAFQAAVSSSGPMIGARIVSGLGMVSSIMCRLIPGVHQLYRARAPNRGRPEQASRSIHLLFPHVAESRYLYRLLDWLRLHPGYRLQGLAHSRCPPSRVHHSHDRPHLCRPRVTPMARQPR